MGGKQDTFAMPMLLHLAHILHGCRTLGPGSRTVLWVRGCSLRCPGCIAAPILGPGPSWDVDPAELATRILSHDDEEGITISGGEPFEQAEPLAILAALVQVAGRSVMVYSGHSLESLRGSDLPGVQDLLAAADILIDGPFIQARQGDLLWRGSDNQRVHFLSPRYANLSELVNGGSVGVELLVDAESGLFWAGIPPRGFQETLRRAAAEAGVVLTENQGVWS